MSEVHEFLRFASLQDPDSRLERSVLIIGAHPDDETIGAGGLLSRLADLTVAHVTDGAPRNLADAQALGFHTAEAYALRRRTELECAMKVAGVSPERVRSLGFADQGTSRDLARVAKAIRDLIEETGPAVILTHPYEGGHPDHDSTAFGVHCAAELLARGGRRPPAIIEFASYHAHGDGMRVSEFLPPPGGGAGSEVKVVLSAAARERKERMYACHQSQAAVLAMFPIGVEAFRAAPRYDFSKAPHPGELNYERHPWGITGEEWRAQAVRALEELKLTR